MGKHRLILIAILALVVAVVVVIVKIPMQLGSDLCGGSQLTLAVQPMEQILKIAEREPEAVQWVIENRANGLSASEAIVQSSGQDQLLAQLPRIGDPAQAQRVLGGGAQLEFCQQKPNAEGNFQAVSQVAQWHEIQQTLLSKSTDTDAMATNTESL